MKIDLFDRFPFIQNRWKLSFIFFCVDPISDQILEQRNEHVEYKQFYLCSQILVAYLIRKRGRKIVQGIDKERMATVNAVTTRYRRPQSIFPFDNC